MFNNLLREEYHFNCKSRVFSYYEIVTPSNNKILYITGSDVVVVDKIDIALNYII